MLQLSFNPSGSQVGRRGTQSFILYRTETPPEGTGFNPLLLWSKPMSIAVYRGHLYNTDRNMEKEFEYRKVTTKYRGIEYTTTVKVEVSK